MQQIKEATLECLEFLSEIELDELSSGNAALIESVEENLKFILACTDIHAAFSKTSKNKASKLDDELTAWKVRQAAEELAGAK